MGDNKDNIIKPSSRSSQSFQISELDEIIKNLPEEYRQVMNQVIVVDVQNVKKDLKDQIFDAKKPELIEKLKGENNNLNIQITKVTKIVEEQKRTIKDYETCCDNHSI